MTEPSSAKPPPITSVSDSSDQAGLRVRTEMQSQKVMLPRGTDLRLAAFATSAWLGALLGLSSSFQPGWATTCMLVFAVLSLVIGGLDRTVLIVVLLSLFVGSSALLAASLARSALENSPPAQAEEGDFVIVDGVVGSDLSVLSSPWNKNSWSFTAHTAARGDVVVVADAKALNAVPVVRGTEVRIEGKLKRTQGLALPYLGLVHATDVKVVRQAPQWQRQVSALKTNLQRVSARWAGSAGPLVVGMAIGDDRGLEQKTKEAMLTTSLTHLCAVSGSHIAITLSVISALIPGRRKAQASATGIFLILVVAVVGPAPSVVRAVSMGALGAWGMTMRRGGQPLALLFAVTTGTLILDPWNATSLGFSLSTIATAGILTLGRSGTKWFRQVMAQSSFLELAHPLLKVLSDAIVIAVVAQIVTLPILALVNPWLPLWGVVANLAVAPIVTPVTLLGLGAAVTCMWFPPGADFCVWLAAPLVRYMEAVAPRVAAWPLARLPWLQGIDGFVLAAVSSGLFIAGFFWLSLRVKSWMEKMETVAR